MLVWDTAGQEKYQTITQSYYKGSTGIILTYAVNDRESFKNIERWLKQIKDNASEDVCKILIGNKCDMPGRQVDESEGKKLADTLGISFLETSAKLNININDCFQTIAKDIKEQMEKVDRICNCELHKKLTTFKKEKDGTCC